MHTTHSSNPNPTKPLSSPKLPLPLFFSLQQWLPFPPPRSPLLLYPTHTPSPLPITTTNPARSLSLSPLSSESNSPSNATLLQPLPSPIPPNAVPRQQRCRLASPLPRKFHSPPQPSNNDGVSRIFFWVASNRLKFLPFIFFFFCRKPQSGAPEKTPK